MLALYIPVLTATFHLDYALLLVYVGDLMFTGIKISGFEYDGRKKHFDGSSLIETSRFMRRSNA